MAAGVVAVLAAVTLIWFQPQKLFYDQRVHEDLPSAAARSTAGDSAPGTGASAGQPVELASGTFISREHETHGTAHVLRLADGRVFVRFQDFSTSNGPLLVVWLSRNPARGADAAFDDQYASLGPLKGNVGDQNYLVPDGVDVSAFTTVVVWCDRFNVSFGAADLEPAT